jgi:Fur family transcriptional regulator, ferric uptake regulator
MIINIEVKMKTPAERLDGYVKQKGLKSSGQRSVILSFMLKDAQHHTVEELYEICKKKNPEIGIATVYRTVKLLCDAGIARELHVNNDVTRYEVITDDTHHDHLVCVSCGSFAEISSEIIEMEQLKIAKQNGFELTDHSLVLYGICSSCVKKGKRKDV